MEIIDLNDQRRKNALTQNQIRKIDNNYEYCIIENYEDVLDFGDAQAIQVGQVFANLLEVKDRLIFVSILFPTSKFDINGVIEWLNNYAIYWNGTGKSERLISGAEEIISGVKFKGCPILLYRRGKKRLDYDADAFIEVTEQYVHFEETKSMLNAKPVTSDEPGLKIYINGERVSEIPRIEFEQENLIISNGNYIVADYMDEYFGCIGFFRDEDPTLPVAWIHDKDTSVFIELLENDDFGLVCILKFSYEIDLDEL